MITYKEYQNKVLTSIDNYLKILHRHKKPSLAFADYFESYNADNHGIKYENYKAYKPYTANKLIPFNCIQVPTGGGKTLLASETINRTFNQLLNRTEGLVLWFVPTEAIYSQTLEKLKDPNDIHRQILQKNFKNLNIFSKDEAVKNLRRRHVVDGSLSVIVSIDKSFTNGTKVLEDGNDGYEEFNSLFDAHSDLLISNTSFEGKDQPVGRSSLFNLIRILNPLVIIDEGHLFKSELITSTIKDLNPSLIWEFSATPFDFSNVIHRTSPIELKKEDMIKLPIQIRHELTWQDVLAKAVQIQKLLEEKAKEEYNLTGRYVRPIVIIRPDQIKDDPAKITPSVIKDYIKLHYPDIKTKDEVDSGSKYQIAERYTESDSKTAKKIDTLGSSTELYKESSEIRYIIAYKAIREGWDCSFAYVYANLSNIRSEVDAEQFIGRILRMPNAKKLDVPELNKAYIITKGNENSRTDMESSINCIVEILVQNGFSKDEAENVVTKTKTGITTMNNPHTFGDGAIENSNTETSLNIQSDGYLDSGTEYPYISKKQINVDSITLPKLYLGNKEFRDSLLLKDFDLNNLNLQNNLQLIQETTGVFEIDFNEGENWQSQYFDNETSVGLFGITVSDLAEFIVNKSKDNYYNKIEEFNIIKKWLSSFENIDINNLKRNLITLTTYYIDQKDKQRRDFKKQAYLQAIESKKFITKDIFELTFEETQEVYYDSGNFTKMVYSIADKLNDLEKDYVNSLNNNPDVEWIYRNRERKDYYIQGWWGRFYPDFIYQTNDGILHIAETKGREDDTDKEKKLLGELVEKLSENIKFELVK